jgi:hypothetical protein
MKFEFSRQFKKNTSNFTKICSVGCELFHAHGQTDRHMTKLTVAFAILRKHLEMNARLHTAGKMQKSLMSKMQIHTVPSIP